MRSAAILLLLMMVCIGCESRRDRLHAIDFAHGVSQSDARIIGECYFAKHIPRGKLTGVQDGGAQWIIEGNIGGYFPKKMSFDVDKRSGKIASQVGPSYDNPLDMYP